MNPILKDTEYNLQLHFLLLSFAKKKVAAHVETNAMVIGHVAAVVTQTLHGGMSAIVVKSQNQRVQVVEVAHRQELQGIMAATISDKAVAHQEVETISDEIKVQCEAVVTVVTAEMIAVDHIKQNIFQILIV